MKFTRPIPSCSTENFCFHVGDYSFGFQAQEQDEEMWGGSVTYKFRVEDPRLGRFFAVDPLYAEYPWNSNYAFSENRLIDAIELEGLELVIVHGTRQTSGNGVFDSNTISQFEKIFGNKENQSDNSFSWGALAASVFNNRNDRYEAAKQLADHVVKVRLEKIAAKEISNNEPITLVGYSHGGNVSIQAAKMIEAATGIKVNIITVATPAYNDASSEDPALNESIESHIHIYSEYDGVDYLANGEETYRAGYQSENYCVGDEYIKDEGLIDTHSNLGNSLKNGALAEFVRTFILHTSKNEKNK